MLLVAPAIERIAIKAPTPATPSQQPTLQNGSGNFGEPNHNAGDEIYASDFIALDHTHTCRHCIAGVYDGLFCPTNTHCRANCGTDQCPLNDSANWGTDQLPTNHSANCDTDQCSANHNCTSYGTDIRTDKVANYRSRGSHEYGTAQISA